MSTTPQQQQPLASPGTTRVGVVGVGRMGANIARRLHDEGYGVAAVSDADPERARELAGEISATVPETLAGVTAACDVVLTVVTDDAAMRAIFARDGDSLLRGARGKVFVNCATITPDVHVEVDVLVREAGAAAVEACMASSIPQARDGTLYLICGGDADAFARVKPLLETMSISLRWVGGPGRAAQVKALVNMLMNINTAGLAEALGLGAALGLDLHALQDVFAHTGANSRVLETDGADMIAREHDVYFSAAHAAKDSGIGLALGERAGLQLPLAAATKAQYDRLVAAGHGELDKSAIAELTFPGRERSFPERIAR
jgi:3-hydroxyisobutyrate dehydrogenase